MPRIRSIKPDFFKDEDICCLPIEARLFFAGLWCQADRNGVVEYRPKRLKVEIMPYDDVDVEHICRTLADPGIGHRPEKKFITFFESEGQQYIKIENWSKHQHPHRLEKPSNLPNILKENNNGFETVQEPLCNGIETVAVPFSTGARTLVSCLLSPVTGLLSPVSGQPDPEPTTIFSDEVFQKLLSVYPAAGQQVGVADGTAHSIFLTDVVVADHGPLLQAAKNYAASKQVADGYCRQIIKFLVNGYWRNWTTVKPSGAAEYVKDTSIQEELAERQRIREENKKNGTTGPTRRPNWATN